MADGNVGTSKATTTVWPVVILEVVLAIVILFFTPLTEFLPRLIELGGLRL